MQQLLKGAIDVCSHLLEWCWYNAFILKLLRGSPMWPRQPARAMRGFTAFSLRLYNYLCLIYCCKAISSDSNKSLQCSINLGYISSCNQMSYFWLANLCLYWLQLFHEPCDPCIQKVLALSSTKKGKSIYLEGIGYIFSPPASLNTCPSTSEAVPIICSLPPTLLTVQRSPNKVWEVCCSLQTWLSYISREVQQTPRHPHHSAAH